MCFCYLFFLGGQYASQWPPFHTVLPRIPIYEVESHGFPCQLSALLGNDKVRSAVHVLQKRHINTEDWLSRELSASKLRKESSFWEASQGSSPYTVIHQEAILLANGASKFIISGICRDTFHTNTSYLASQSPSFTPLLLLPFKVHVMFLTPTPSQTGLFPLATILKY